MLLEAEWGGGGEEARRCGRVTVSQLSVCSSVVTVISSRVRLGPCKPVSFLAQITENPVHISQCHGFLLPAFHCTLYSGTVLCAWSEIRVEERSRHRRCVAARRPRWRAAGYLYLGTGDSWEFQRGATLPESNSNRTRNLTMQPCQLTSSTTQRHVMERLANLEDFKRRLRTWQRGRTTAASRSQITSMTPTKAAPRSAHLQCLPTPQSTELRKAQAARRRRQKDSYGLLTASTAVKNIYNTITQNFFQNGRDVQLPTRQRSLVTDRSDTP